MINNQVSQTVDLMRVKAKSLRMIAVQFESKGDTSQATRLITLATRIDKAVVLLETYEGQWHF